MRRLFTIAPFVLVIAGAALMGALARTPEGQIAAGVRVGSLALGGKSQEEARAALEKWIAQQQETPVALRFAPETGIKRVWKTNARQLGLGIDVAATLDAASKSGSAGVVAEVKNWVSGAEPVQVPVRTTVDTKVLRAVLAQIAQTVNRKPRDARLILLKGGGFGIRGEKPGLAMDMAASLSAVTEAWESTLTPVKTPPHAALTPDPSPTLRERGEANTPPPSEGGGGGEVPPPAPQRTTPGDSLDVTLAAKEAPAALTRADLQQIDGELGSFSTHFGGTGANRGSNIALAASHINGTLLRPGEIFSYNKVVGPRIGSAGFKNAPVIIKGELVPGIGGGICQVSSTLYNAVLLSDLKIVRRSHHAFPVHYLPAGRDATVVDGAIDFQFQNSTPAPVYIAASARRGRLSFTLFGKKTPGRTVSIELAGHQVLPNGMETRRDPSLPAGRRVVKDRGHRGHRVTVYRVVRENGQVVRKEVVSRDHYRPFPAIVLVGTRPVAAKPKAAPTTAPTTPPLTQPPSAPGETPGE
jgi:vancomycin resistance protein YoaR